MKSLDAPVTNLLRHVIRFAYRGEDPADLSALENRQAVEEIGTLRK